MPILFHPGGLLAGPWPPTLFLALRAFTSDCSLAWNVLALSLWQDVGRLEITCLVSGMLVTEKKSRNTYEPGSDDGSALPEHRV